jgi:uncharacterized protein YjbJ (UPF0337 family)
MDERVLAQPGLSAVRFSAQKSDLRMPSVQGDVMNEDTFKGQWTQLKGEVREQWGKLTDDDVDQIQGRSEQLIGKIQERYGVARDEAQRQVNSWTAQSRR